MYLYSSIEKSQTLPVNNEAIEKLMVDVKNDINPISGKRFHVKFYHSSDFSEDDLI
jgi:hypothetical protein